MRSILPMLVLSLALLVGCGEKVKPPIQRAGTEEQSPDQESWNSRVIFSDSGLVRAELYARHIRMYRDRRETLLDSGIVVDFYDRNEQHTSRLTARRGRVDDETKNLEAFEDVVFSSDSGTVVETEYIFWDNALKVVRGDRFVTITSPKERLQGYGFEADQGLKNYTVFGKVSGEAEIKKE
ncbi:MAG: LPS export ABC transporter periplasmic protein LptC [Bacteroidia bacterium]|nr:LPS export ABC transporter periplasmic protein LptC [Bacteroidia bacterium]